MGVDRKCNRLASGLLHNEPLVGGFCVSDKSGVGYLRCIRFRSRNYSHMDYQLSGYQGGEGQSSGDVEV